MPAQGTRWSIPPHGVVRYAETGGFTGVRADGSTLSLLDSASTTCHPLLFADELAADGRNWGVEPWSLPAIPIWLALDLRTFDRPGDVRHVWPRIADFGEVTFVGTAAAPDADGWQRITGQLKRVPVRERANASKREIELDRWYLANALEVKLELRRRFEPDSSASDRYARRGVVSAIEFTLAGRVEADNPRQWHELSGKRTWRLVGTYDNRSAPTPQHPGFEAMVAQATQAAVARQLDILRAFEGTVAEDEGRGALHGPALHAALLYGAARAGCRAGDPAIDAALGHLLQRDHTRAHGFAFRILAIAGLHAPADERTRCLRGQPSTLQLPPPMRAAMEQAVAGLLRIRLHTKAGTGFWPFAADSRECSLLHSCLAIQALDVATRCGIRVPADVFEGFARHLVATAIDVPGIAAARLELEPGLARATPKERSRVRASTDAAACAWNDTDLGAFGSDGADIAFAMAALLAGNRHVRDAELRAQALVCVERGWAWLGHHFTARHAPSVMHVERQRRFEGTFAMAWLLDETGVRMLNGHDVYFECASVRLADTRDSGVVATTVGDAPAALALWRPHVGPLATITPGR
jgi:hypothetical protein